MNVDDRIRRRIERDSGRRLLRDGEALSPVAHLDEPVGRGSALERLLDALSPAFDSSVPADGYVYGPSGSGKSAIVTVLFRRLHAASRRSRRGIATTTRASDPRLPLFGYVDARSAGSEAAFYRQALATLSEGESVPGASAGVAELRRRLDDLDLSVGAVLAVDHLGEPAGLTVAEVDDLLDEFDRISRLAIGRAAPATLDTTPGETVVFDRYRQHALVDVLTERASEGVPAGELAHVQCSRLADWAEGDAHDGLAALLGAVLMAEEAGTGLTDEALTAGMEAVPRSGASLGRVLGVSETKLAVLDALVRVDPAARETVSAATAAVAERVDLSASTVRRHLYELSERGITRHVTVERAGGKGRPPSRVEPAFPTRVYRYLRSLD